jgi:hypothetical protein
MPRKLPTGVQTFRIVQEEYELYVDKTELIYNMINNFKVVFLSRPRRFGKSLICSILSSIFKNERELFKGLAIDALPWEWKEYPVIHLDLSVGNFHDGVEALNSSLNRQLENCAENYEITLKEEKIPDKFANLIRILYKAKGPVVVIIDKYDNPLLSTIDKPEINENLRNALKGFYSVIKSSGGFLKFAFITGVTKFSQVSVFSGMNQPEDISMKPEFAALCGVTQKELEYYFAPDIEEYAELRGGKEKYLERLKTFYNGYRFSKKEISVYNPTSLIKHFINDADFRNYWAETGNPSFLKKYLESKYIDLANLENADLEPESFANYRGDDLDLLPILYQAGYLTIADYDCETNLFKLKYPNAEIRNSFASFLGTAISPISFSKQSSTIAILIKALKAGDIKTFMETMQVYMSGIDYSLITRLTEHYFEFAFSNILNMLGIVCKVESHNCVGCVDAVVEIGDYVYVIEAKLDKPVEEALKQIEEKAYAVPFVNSGKKVVKLGVVFSSEKRNIMDWR